MKIRKIDFSNPESKEAYLNITEKEIREIHNKIVFSYETYLKDYGVKKLWRDDIPADCNDIDFVSFLDAKEL